VNNDQFERIVGKVASKIELDGARVAMLGLAFKAGTDDTRESPALEVAKRFLAAGSTVRAYDPAVTDVPIDGIEVVADAYAACERADALVVATEWDEFKWLDLDKIADAMAQLHIVDARNLLDRGAVRRRGFTYQGVGRS
jgi:UDPglucose 6-dehydrogenase